LTCAVEEQMDFRDLGNNFRWPPMQCCFKRGLGVLAFTSIKRYVSPLKFGDFLDFRTLPDCTFCFRSRWHDLKKIVHSNNAQRLRIAYFTCGRVMV